jgi:hypothetical protein
MFFLKSTLIHFALTYKITIGNVHLVLSNLKSEANDLCRNEPFPRKQRVMQPRRFKK